MNYTKLSMTTFALYHTDKVLEVFTSKEKESPCVDKSLKEYETLVAGKVEQILNAKP